jgi:isochorismate synthase
MSSADILIACLERSLPFVAYRLPHKNKIQLLIPEKIIPFFFQADSDMLSQEAFCIVPFDNEHEPAFLLYPRFDEALNSISSSKLDWIMQQPLCETSLTFCPEEKENSYAEAFQKAQALFACGVQKIVLSRRKLIENISLKQAPDIFLRLCEQQNNTFNYFLSLPQTGVWLGASPELLLKNDGENIQTTSLAGTIPADAGFNWTNKEKEEQGFVTDYISDLLYQFGLTNYQKEATISAVSSNVQHLKTAFIFPRNEIQFPVEKLLYALHPTPAVNGLPKKEAKDFILRKESNKRELYAGFLGKIEKNGQFDLYVTIRCMQFFSNGAGLYVGGGLTAGSDFTAEWAETELKAKGLINLF